MHFITNLSATEMKFGAWESESCSNTGLRAKGDESESEWELRGCMQVTGDRLHTEAPHLLPAACCSFAAQPLVMQGGKICSN